MRNRAPPIDIGGYIETGASGRHARLLGRRLMRRRRASYGRASALPNRFRSPYRPV